MRLVLVIGASSQVGSALAQAFAPGCAMILAGRDTGKLAVAAGACLDAGASNVAMVASDLSRGAAALLQAIAGQRVDLIIDAASASSGRRDPEIEADAMGDLVTADFLSRTEMFEHILRTQATPPAVIFISSALTLVRSPGRTVYTALKSLYEVYLGKLKEGCPNYHLLVVHVGVVIAAGSAPEKPRKLAASVHRAFANKKEKLFFGLSGMILVGLFYLQPLVFLLVTLAQRQVRKLLS